LLVVLGGHLRISSQAKSSIFLHLGLLLTMIIIITYSIVQYTSLSIYSVPVASVAMLTMLLFNSSRITFLMAFISSLFVSHMLGGDFGMMIMFLSGSLVGAYTVRDARTRGQLITAGLFVSVVQVIAIVLIYPSVTTLLDGNFITYFIYPTIANGFTVALFVAATLKIFESVFGVLTNFSLLELSDFNHPLLKRMIMEAPGTYHHSLVVSNLAEAAASEIGANGLLTRVGAYYHDIGKMAKPEYFTENQLACGNKHDNIEPSMSRLVIINHVKDGIELAKKYKLNQAIIDFIPQHHGTSLIFYFHQRALAEAEDAREVKEENYRYPGPKPQMRETAITLLADSVEGATRSLDEHTPQNIKDTVHKIVNNKFIDGQLDECPLTLKEIDKISKTFIRILSAMYHGRVKYPEKKKENGNTHKKPSEKNNSQAHQDKEPNQKSS
ncbi:MAG: putative nucleotidyltransferase with HDIG domain, partial [Candidatus Omnitrophota bacterium]